MGAMIIYFNIKGYDILFRDEKILGIASPFSLLIGIAEVSVLIWTYNVISDWPNTSRVLKTMLFILVPSFSFLCFSGINSYLTILAHSEYQVFHEVKMVNKNNDKYLLSKENESSLLQNQLNLLRNESQAINTDIAKAMKESAKLVQQSSERRRTVTDCSKVPDCMASVKNIDLQIGNMQDEVSRLNANRISIENRIKKLSSNFDGVVYEIDEIKKQSIDKVNELVDVETTYTIKKETYENIILTVASWFGITPKNPFSIFLNIISMLVYPVYFILNLLLALNSDTNKERRTLKNNRMLERDEEKYKFKAVQYSTRSIILKKIMKYLRVWAHARKKTKIEHVEIPVEKIVEKEVKVDRLVPVDKEVPVYIEKLVKVPEPYVVKEPTIVIKEKILPVPENITSKELEELVNEQLRSEPIQQNSETETITENEKV